MRQEKFNSLNEKLEFIKESTREIENFTHKQTELFAVLHKKFPTIEQFSNALKDAEELFGLIEDLQKDADICLDGIKEIQNDQLIEFQKNRETKEIKTLLYQISLQVDEINDISSLQEQLRTILKQVGE
jgi:hypothetical protein